MIILNQSIYTMQSYDTWVKIALSFILKLKTFKRTLQMMFQKDLIHQIMQLKDHYQKVKIIG